jgi:hypothetical protein
MSKLNDFTPSSLKTALGLQPVQTGTYLDMFDLIDDEAYDASLRTRVITSLAWALDYSAIAVATSAFFQFYRDSKTHFDSYNDFLSMMSAYDHADKTAHEMGLTLSANSLHELGILLKLADAAHEHAEQYALSNGASEYKRPTFEYLLENNLGTERLSADEKERKRMEAMFAVDVDEETDENKEMLDEIQAALIKRAESGKARRAQEAQERIPAILRILTNAALNSNDNFFELSIERQKRLFESAHRAINNAIERASEDRKITTAEFTLMIRDARSMRKQLDAAMNLPKFNDNAKPVVTH